jgi:hypothetical protein
MLAYFLGFAIVFSLVIMFISFYVRRVADLGLTDQFRAAESIVNGFIPEKWIAQINRRMALYRLLSILKYEASGKDLALQKIDQLYRYFDRSLFYESPEARQMLLTQIQETRVCWAHMTWQEILTNFDPADRSAVEKK